MARKTQTLTIDLTPEQLLAMDRHTDWRLAHERGAHRNGRPYLAGGVQGAHKTRKAQSKSACRGRVRHS